MRGHFRTVLARVFVLSRIHKSTFIYTQVVAHDFFYQFKRHRVEKNINHRIFLFLNNKKHKNKTRLKS